MRRDDPIVAGFSCGEGTSATTSRRLTLPKTNWLVGTP